MKISTLCLLFICFVLNANCQKKEEFFDYHFKPSEMGGRYYVITEKKENQWYRVAYYFPERTLAMTGRYTDEACIIAQDTISWYHPSGYLKSQGRYQDGKRQGTWLWYNEKGILTDSANYQDGRLKGVSLGWHANGIMSDSSSFDGHGNGVRIHWDIEGRLISAGYLEQDTLKKGRWKYFHPDGSLLAIADYTNGKRINCECYDETGKKLDSATCNTEQEASFPDGLKGW